VIGDIPRPMPALVSRDRPRWTWPVAWSLALASLVLVALLPQRWWNAVWPDGRLAARATEPPPAAFELVELAPGRPPSPIESDESPPTAPTPPRAPEAAWWEVGFRARIVADFAAPPVLPDSLLPRPLLELWGARATTELILAAPDSAVHAQLWWLVQEERLAASDLGGLFTAIARARAYADLRSREAAMFDEFLNETVPVPR